MKLAVVNACYQPSDNIYFEKRDSLKSAMESMSVNSEYDVTFFCCTQDSYNKTLHHAGVTYDFATGQNIIDAIKNCARHVAQWRPDGIIIEDFNNPVVPMLQRMLPDTPKLLIFCGGKLKPPPIACTAVMVASEAMAEILRAQGYRGSIISAAFTVDTELFKPNPNVKKLYDVIYVADWRENKRQMLLMQALSQSTFTACFAGAQNGIYSEWYYNQCKKRFHSLNIANRITLVNRIPGEQMPPVYQQAKMAIHLGLSTEGGARSIMEAMACGLPVIVADDCLSNTSRVTHMREGMHVRPDPESIAAGVTALLRDDHARRKYGILAREKALKLWYLNRMEKEFREVFQVCLSRK